MARYGRDRFAGYSRDYQGFPRGGAYGRDHGGGYGRDFRRGYDGGWGMTGLYNTIMRRGPQGGRYGERSYNPPLRPGQGSYAGGNEPRTGGYGGRWRGRAGYAPDFGSVGIHYRPYERNRY